ncbi:MAG: helix-turn-helix transcriptional regulator [Lachnospiraceae bacterium]|nr:helix-turn-helix transcriptional regulator [Lachnospiraceae bacterium]MDE6980911.1 helix-turn-helix transcriptional regulator [Lachnospiraceae bacterium]
MGNFAKVFRELRTKSGLTQQEMADKLDISRSSIGMYENGEREPGFELLETIADYFNVDMNYLLGKKDSSQQREQGYYLDEDARDMAQFLFDNPEYKVLLDATRKTKKEDILFVKEMIDRINSGRK